MRNYKRLAEVEQAFRSLKSPDLRVRPIRHRLAERVRAHVLLCMLAYYVQWHLKRAWEPLLFEEEDMQTIRNQRAPVAPAEPSAEVQEKKVTHQTANGLPAQSFTTLLRELGRRCRNTCLVVSDPSGNTFDQVHRHDTAPGGSLPPLGPVDRNRKYSLLISSYNYGSYDLSMDGTSA